MKNTLLFLSLLLIATLAHAQLPPWKAPLKMAWSNDGTTFTNSSIFQDSSGVPCVIRWKGDTLIAALQWFRGPQNAPTWDRVAVKFSYDAGLSWTPPTTIVVDGLPANYQRPFDPTLTLFNGDSIRLYFSSSEGIPMGGLNETVNCYSAKSKDGVHYTFEPNARVDQPTNPLIDPALTYFNGTWHYIAPIGTPQQGAYHYTSNDGLSFSKLFDIPSNYSHNWTGNLMVNNTTELRFYGSGESIWYNTSPDGFQWNGFVATNTKGGDPSVLQLSDSSYLMVYVGPPYTSGTDELVTYLHPATVFPNPASGTIHLVSEGNLSDYDYAIFSTDGRLLKTGSTNSNTMSLEGLSAGCYFLKVLTGNNSGNFGFIKN